MSEIFQKVMHELGIKQYRSSAYHPESQGDLERFPKTLKTLLDPTALTLKRIWMNAFSYCCLPLGSLCKNISVSDHFSLYLIIRYSEEWLDTYRL